MDRPYLKSGKKGVTRNLYDEVKDYADREGLIPSNPDYENQYIE